MILRMMSGLLLHDHIKLSYVLNTSAGHTTGAFPSHPPYVTDNSLSLSPQLGPGNSNHSMLILARTRPATYTGRKVFAATDENSP